MTVSEADRIDIVASKDGKIILAMVEVRPWDSGTDVREELRRKIVSYLGFIKGDDYRKQFGEAEAAILIMGGGEPTDEIRTMVANAARTSGVEITFEN